MASGGMVLIKYLLFFFNFIFWVSGLVLIGIGVWIKLKYSEISHLNSSDLLTGPVFLIIIGVVVTIVGFLGCCGAYKENYCMVTTFAVLLSIIFILEIAAGAVAYAYRGKLSDWAKKGLDDGVYGYYNNKEYKKAIDKIQSELECCGVNNYTDYFNASSSSDELFPASCCKLESQCETLTIKAAETKAKRTFWEEGCVDKFEAFLKSNLAIVGGVGIGIAFIQLIGIVFACCLMRSIKKEYEVM